MKMRTFTGRLAVLATGAVLGLGGVADGAYFQNFETLADGSISGQDGWTVDGGDPASGLVVTDGTVAYDGVKSLYTRQGGGSAARIYRSVVAPLGDYTNNIVQFALRFDTLDANQLRVYYNANGGPTETIATRFDDQGAIFTSAGGFNNETVSLGASLQTGQWYNVSYVLKPSMTNYNFSIIRAIDSALVLNTNLPFATAALATTANNIEFYVDGDATFNYKIDALSITSSIPEPSSIALLMVGGVLVWRARRRRAE